MNNNEELTLTQRILVRAAELASIKENWCKGWLEDNNGRYCMLGAIRRATKDVTGSCSGSIDWWERGPTGEVVTIIAKQVPRADIVSVHKIHRYNDDIGRTHEEVKAVFCAAVKEELGYDPTVSNDDTAAE